MGITSIFWNRKGAPAGDIFVPTGQTTGYIDLPIETFFSEYLANANVALQRLIPRNSGTSAGLFYYPTAAAYAENSYRTLAWLYGGISTGASITNRFHCNFRLPGDYIDNTDLTLNLSSTYTVVDNSTPATTATIDAEAYRNVPGTDKEGFGYRANPVVDTWTETDLIAAAPTNVLRHTTASSEFDANTFTIDGDHATYPLTPGNLMQVRFTSVIDDNGSNAAIYFANFYITYDKWAA